MRGEALFFEDFIPSARFVNSALCAVVGEGELSLWGDGGIIDDLQGYTLVKVIEAVNSYGVLRETGRFWNFEMSEDAIGPYRDKVSLECGDILQVTLECVGSTALPEEDRARFERACGAVQESGIVTFRFRMSSWQNKKFLLSGTVAFLVEMKQKKEPTTVS